MAMNITEIQIGRIFLDWSDWHAWSRLEVDARSDPEGITPPKQAGVYEARLTDREERLTIGKAHNLRMRVKQGLVRGKAPHSSGEKIRESEETSAVVIRWAVTDRPAAVEEELHRCHSEEFGSLPTYTERT